MYLSEDVAVKKSLPSMHKATGSIPSTTEDGPVRFKEEKRLKSSNKGAFEQTKFTLDSPTKVQQEGQKTELKCFC